MIILIKRFSKNNWDYEKNPTIVNFPIKNADFVSCKWFVLLIIFHLSLISPSQSLPPSLLGLKDPNMDTIETHYDLVANVTHEGKPGPGNGVYKAQVRSKANELWFEVQDLFVDQKTPQMIFLSESYIQFWERKDLAKPPTSST